jgi:hypothetical protein
VNKKTTTNKSRSGKYEDGEKREVVSQRTEKYDKEGRDSEAIGASIRPQAYFMRLSLLLAHSPHFVRPSL